MGGELRVQAEFLELAVDFEARTFHKFGATAVQTVQPLLLFQRFQRLRHTLEPVLMVQQRAYLYVLAHDRTPFGRRMRDLPHRGDGVDVGHLICDRAKQRHQEHRDRAGCDQCRRGVALHGADLHRQRRDGDDDRQRGRAIQGYGDAVMR